MVNDSNLDWNQSLPEVKAFADQHGLQSIDLDQYGFTDPTFDVPQSKIWDCQRPTAADAGQWAALSANMIMDGHNCIWLMQYEHQSLAGGSMYAVHLPDHIPEAGSPGGPPGAIRISRICRRALRYAEFFPEHHPRSRETSASLGRNASQV